MPVLLRVCTFVLLLLVTGCIGSSLHRYGSEGEIQNGAREIDELFNKQFIGMSRDELIIKYGPPSRTLSLDNGSKLIQYNAKRTWISQRGNHYRTSCELRLWMQNKIVHHVDYRGDQTACASFMDTARQTIIEDDRTPK